MSYVRGKIDVGGKTSTSIIKLRKIINTLEINGINYPNKIWYKYSFKLRLEIYKFK
jgi:hypothetical protein